LSSPITFVAEDSVSCSWPGLSPLGARAEDEATVKALEAVDVVILVQSPNPGGLGLTLLWLNWLLAASAHQGEHLVITFTAVRSILLVKSHHFSIKPRPARDTSETVVMESGLSDHQGRVTILWDLLAAGGAGPGGDKLVVVLLAHDHPLHVVDLVQDQVVTHRAHVTHAPEVLLTDGEIIEGEIFVTNLLPTDLTLHAFSVITLIPEGDVTLGDDLFADKASGCVVAVSTARTTGLHEELLTQSLLAELTPEA